MHLNFYLSFCQKNKIKNNHKVSKLLYKQSLDSILIFKGYIILILLLTKLKEIKISNNYNSNMLFC